MVRATNIAVYSDAVVTVCKFVEGISGHWNPRLIRRFQYWELWMLDSFLAHIQDGMATVGWEGILFGNYDGGFFV